MAGPTDALVIFARAPRLGSVKTRVAATLGDDRALAIHRELAEHAVRAARASGAGVTVSFTPADAHAEMRAWLGDGLAFESQCAGDLGARMSSAIAARLDEGADRVVVVGTDCPDLAPSTIETALDALSSADVVFGPAMDGGYYLVAMRTLHAEIFRDVPWSTADTLTVSLQRAAGLRVTLLEPLRDVDSEADWRWYEARRAISG